MVVNILKKNDFIFSTLVGIGSIGIGVSLFVTSKWGIGISPDSAAYISCARNLLNGLGLSTFPFDARLVQEGCKPVPLTHFPPLFSLLLGIIGKFGVDPLAASRWLVALLFGANIILIGFIIHRMNRSLSPTILGMFLILTSEDMIRTHIWAMTEPLFIFLILLGLYILACYLTNLNMRDLIYSASAISLAFLTRFSAFPMIITGAIGILYLAGVPFRRKVIDGTIFLLIGCIPIGLWAIRNISLGEPASREIYFHPVTYETLIAGLSTISSWLVPIRIPPPFKLILFLLLVLAFVLVNGLMKNEEKKLNTRDVLSAKLSALLNLFMLIYSIFLIISISFFDAHMPLDQRILSPLYPAVVIVMVARMNRLLFSSKDCRTLSRFMILICVGFLVLYTIRSYHAFVPLYENGIGFNNKHWHESEMIREIKNIPLETPIYTNAPDLVYIMNGRCTCWIPRIMDLQNARIDPNYLSGLKLMVKTMNKHDGLLVYFSPLTFFRSFLPSEVELKENVDLILDKKLKDGSIYRVRRPAQ
jgi:hypothetical protein